MRFLSAATMAIRRRSDWRRLQHVCGSGLSLSLLLSVLLLAATSCQRHAVLNGEVFLVTQGGPSIKLGLVQVTVIREDTLQAFARRMPAQIARDTLFLHAAIEATIDSLNIKVTPIRNELLAAEQAYNSACAEETSAMNRILASPNYDGDPSSPLRISWKRATASVAIAKRRRDEARKRAESNPGGDVADVSAARLEEIMAAFGGVPGSAAYWYRHLPAGFATTKTDADGRFGIQLPSRDRVALAAKAQRQTPGGPEDYYWVVWARPGDRAEDRVFLSNDNLMTVSSPATAIYVRN